MKRTRLKPQSARRVYERAERAQVIDDVLERDHWVCQARHLLGTPCEGLLTAHEVVQRSVRPGSHLERELCVCICDSHHSWVHDHIAESREFGLIRMSWEVDADGHLLPMDGAA